MRSSVRFYYISYRAVYCVPRNSGTVKSYYRCGKFCVGIGDLGCGGIVSPCTCFYLYYYFSRVSAYKEEFIRGKEYLVVYRYGIVLCILYFSPRYRLGKLVTDDLYLA